MGELGCAGTDREEGGDQGSDAGSDAGGSEDVSGGLSVKEAASIDISMGKPVWSRTLPLSQASSYSLVVCVFGPPSFS